MVHRAQLYYLRGLTGKAARIKERRYNPAAEAAKRAARAAALAATQAPLAAAPVVSANGAAEEYEDAFNRAVLKRFRRFALEIEDR